MRFRTATLVACLFIGPVLCAQSSDESARIFEAHKHLAGYNRGGDSLRKKLALSPDKSVKVYHYAPAEGRLDSAPGSSLKQLFQIHICQADAIVVGSVKTIKSLLSANESQVFTDYQITPLTIIKGRDLTPGIEFYITQPGGTIDIDGGEIIDIGSEYPSPLFPRKTYLLFLKMVDSTKTFRPLDNLSTYLPDGSHIRTVTESAERDSMNNFLLSLSPGSLSTYLTRNMQSCGNYAQ
ncbi:MAG TPA: hypothetical protein VN517_01265 [Terriglobales bacterium]|nr:hypothetical protein [Terriglobales bacterium]